METEPPQIVKCLGYVEVYSWSELFRFAHSGNAEDLVNLYAQEATAYVSESIHPLRTANVQISSWFAKTAGLDGFPGIGVGIERITVRVDIAEAGFKFGNNKFMANAISLDNPTLLKRYMEPMDLLPYLYSHLWYVKHWPGAGFPGVSKPGPSGRKPWRKWRP